MTPEETNVLIGRLLKVNPWSDLDWPEVLRTAAFALAQLTAEIAELRSANKKLHRRAQLAEAFMQAADNIPNGWLPILRNRPELQDIVSRYIVGEIAKAKDRARAALEAKP